MKTISEKREKIYNVLKSEMSEPLKVLEIESIILSEMTALMKEQIDMIMEIYQNNPNACNEINEILNKLDKIAHKHGIDIN